MESQPWPALPATEAVLTISAFPCSSPASRSIPRLSRVEITIARRFRSSCMSIFFVGYPSIAPPRPTPALFTSTSIRPQRSRCSSTARTTSSSSVICAATAVHVDPGRAQVVRRRLQLLRAPRRDRHPIPVLAERTGDRQTDAARTTSNQRRSIRHFSSSRRTQAARNARNAHPIHARQHPLGTLWGALSTIACRASLASEHLRVPRLGARRRQRRMRRRRRAVDVGRASDRRAVRRRLPQARRRLHRRAHRRGGGDQRGRRLPVGRRLRARQAALRLRPLRRRRPPDRRRRRGHLLPGPEGRQGGGALHGPTREPRRAIALRGRQRRGGRRLERLRRRRPRSTRASTASLPSFATTTATSPPPTSRRPSPSGPSPASPPKDEPAPSVHTPTLDDVGDVSDIDTRTPPSTMHSDDLADVLGEKPVVLLFATPRSARAASAAPSSTSPSR